MKLCKRGLHKKEHAGECIFCRRERQHRYGQTEKGRERSRRSSAKHRATMPGLTYQKELLRSRRWKALRERERRHGGPVQDEG